MNADQLTRLLEEIQGLQNERADLLDLLTLALPYVEEGEQFNKPTARTLSSEIRDIITRLS